MTSEKTLHKTARLRRNLRASTGDATAYGVMVGIGETYFPAFALALGFSDITSGLISSLPLIVGGILQAVSPWILKRGVTPQAWILTAASFQTLSLLPMVWGALTGQLSVLALFAAASLYWAGGLATGPAWNLFTKQIIPKQIRTNYFAARTRSQQIATLLGFLTGGFLLEWSRPHSLQLTVFAVLFAIAFLSRSYSIGMLAIQRAQIPQEAGKGIADDYRGQGRFSPTNLILYLALVQGMVQLSGPYFTPYMLSQLSLSYSAYAVLMATAFGTKIIALGVWGQLAERRGAEWLLIVGGTAIVPLAPLWIFSDNYYYFIGIQAVSGIAWAAYELGLFLLLFESLPIERQLKLLTIYNLCNTAAWAVGSLVGAALLRAFDSSVQGYYVLFAVSSAGRLIALFYLLSHRPSVFVRVHQIGLRILGIRANAAPLESPILDDE